MENGRMYSGYYKLTEEDLKDIKPMSTRAIVAAALGIDEKDVCCAKCICSIDSGARPGLVECMILHNTVDCGSYCKLFLPKSERSKQTMKKLFISCPMRGRKDEDIKKSFERMHRIAEAIFDEKLEVIDTFIQNDPPATKSIAIWYLGESIKKMANADYFIGVRDCWAYNGCSVERAVADYYDIPMFLVDLEYAAPDVEKIEPTTEPCT